MKIKILESSTLLSSTESCMFDLHEAHARCVIGLASNYKDHCVHWSSKIIAKPFEHYAESIGQSVAT